MSIRRFCCFSEVGAAVAAVAIVATASSAAQAQAQRGRLLVTVLDPSGAVIPTARVIVTGEDDAIRAREVAPVLTSSVGVATLEDLSPGRYTVQVEFAGFETGVIRDVRVRSGDNRRSITLQIKKVAEDVSVGRDKQSAALDPLGNVFSTVLTREQIAALPDDPDEMEQVLKQMAPPGSTIRVDGFTGGKLPPKSQIRSIRLPRMDMLAAQNHGGLQGMMFIDIMTQPGLGPLRGSTDFSFRDDALNARNPFTPSKGDEGLRQYGGSLSGTIVQGKTSFSLSGQGGQQYDTGNLLAALPDGSTRAEPVRRPTDRLTFSGRLDTAINKDHTLRVNYQRNSSNARNLGVGAYDLPDRAYSSKLADNVFRVSENGPVGRRFFSESRLQVHWLSSETRSALELPTTRVLDAFTSGGAQQSGGQHSLEFEAATDLDYVRGRHSWRAGVLLEAGRYRSDDATNYLGTFTFANLDDYLAGRPRTYTRRLGDPNVRYSNVQAGVYVQDDFRLLKSVMVSYGLRYEAQSLIADQNNWSPRVSVTWAPFKSGKTSIRAGFGSFSDWLGTQPYKQTIQVDGFRQRELNILNPSYPDAGLAGTTPPTNRYLLGSSLVLPESITMNAGIEQALTRSLRLTAAYTYRRGSQLLRGRNLNSPVNGVRPDPDFSNVIEVESDAASRTHALHLGGNLSLFEWHRTMLFFNYMLAHASGNAAGPFWLPANGDDLSSEWGPTQPRHRFSAAFNTQLIPDLGISVNVRGQSGSPYNLTTGSDDNADGVFNDRPAGVSRNSAWTTGQWDVGARISYAIGFGRRAVQTPGGAQVIVRIGGGDTMPGGFSGGAENHRYRLEFYAAGQNITNHKNYIGYSGVMVSPFFGKPTNVLNPRKIEMGARFGF